MDGVQPVDPAAALAGIGRGAALQQCLDHLVRAARHAEIGPPYPADLVRVRPDMDKRQLRLRRRREAVGLADRVGHAFAERDHQIGLLHLADQRGRHADAHIAAEIRMGRVEQLRPAMRRADRHDPFFGKPVEVGEDRLVEHRVGQQRAADQDQRPLRLAPACRRAGRDPRRAARRRPAAAPGSVRRRSPRRRCPPAGSPRPGPGCRSRRCGRRGRSPPRPAPAR